MGVDVQRRPFLPHFKKQQQQLVRKINGSHLAEKAGSKEPMRASNHESGHFCGGRHTIFVLKRS
jgi:hypothetical protein